MKHLKTFEGYNEQELGNVETFNQYEQKPEIENRADKVRRRIEEYQAFEAENEQDE